ncbi:helix-turn-helix domain containing protein [Capnocytophaga catalasegens]|uniref:Bacteriophage CI repressor N-terminal domain-containing protein n=1 Tax=Capnocytophaga catalasegens TaxID=1004260 RepID=A0AAV5AUG8_9FLAO|nr:helix-turn-helix domain containing protein [Capnocytophaga catalasegens]GIZ16364.1 hypothetical protein RCZ03_23640 [Capnocytophaga catalasegens]GJM49905.1 hypothetical protein RCZ15_08800 [Capnocytophaga catalasegens]GJM54256.1 hypothetical protein RCZ16_25720 [Capnocytophaga catalasegens]
MDKTLILNKIIEYKKFKSDAEFARFLEIPAQNLSKWKSRNTYDVELLYTKCPELNPEWLLIGKEPMLKNEQNQPSVGPANDNEVVALLKKNNALLEKNVAILEENKALLQAENERLKAEIQALKSSSAQSARAIQPSQPTQPSTR